MMFELILNNYSQVDLIFFPRGLNSIITTKEEIELKFKLDQTS
jgi:hypothetical protein